MFHSMFNSQALQRFELLPRFRSGLLKSCLALIAVGLAAQAANAQVSGGLIPGGPGGWVPPSGPGYPGPSYPGPGYEEPGYPGYRPPSSRTDTVRMTIGRQYQGFTQLNVTQLMSMAVQGREVLSLSVRMNAQGGRSHAILLENGRAIGQPVIVPSYMIDADFYVERPNARNLLELNLNGPVYISEITATVRDVAGPGRPGRPGRPGGGHYGPIELREFVGQAFYNGDYLNIDQLVGLHNHYGRSVKKIVIRGSSQRGRGTAELLINGFGQRSTVTLGTSLREYTIRTNALSRVGYEVQSLDLELRGNVFIESVTVELE